MSTLFFHVDMDAFYASVEQHDTPALRGVPVVVGGRSGRGVVAACSYESRTFGVHSAMPMQQALRLCPDAVVVPVRMRRYREVSRQIMKILGESAPAIQAISIDEAFLDMSGTERLLGAPEEQARQLKERIRAETGLTISVGIAVSRFIAKLASDVDKPDGLYRVPAGGEADFVLQLPLKDLWGLGGRTRSRLERLGVTTVAALREQRVEFLRGHFGPSSGTFLYRIARGEDPGIYTGAGDRHSISAEETFEQDITDEDELRRHMLLMAEEVIHRSIQEGWRGRTIQVKYRFPPFETHTASRTLPRQVESTEELTAIAMELLRERRGQRPLRLLGVGLGGELHEPAGQQQDLFSAAEPAPPPIDPTIVDLRRRFGHSAIGRASTITDDSTERS
ncbi:MAG: DNA polymerase IV [Spirochaeta sp.]|nr:DNA polymerase IV [Spirochaeta sp.]